MAPSFGSFDKLLKLWEHSYHENHDSELMSLAMKLQDYNENKFTSCINIPEDLTKCKNELVALRTKHNSAKELLDKEMYCNNWLRMDREIIKKDIQSVIELLVQHNNVEACKHLAAMALHLSKPLPKKHEVKTSEEFSEVVTSGSVGCTRDIHLTTNMDTPTSPKEQCLQNQEETYRVISGEDRVQDEQDSEKLESLNLAFVHDIPRFEVSDSSLILSSPRKDLNFCFARDIPAPIAPPLKNSKLKALFEQTKILKYNVISSTPAQNSDVLQQMNRLHNGHTFIHKNIYWSGKCQSCAKKLAIGKPAYKCNGCRSVCHFDCIFNLPLPCVAPPGPVSPKEKQNKLEDHVPTSAPIVPAVVISCTYEIERRGLKDEGIYRLSCSDAELKNLKEKYAKSRNIPILRNMDIHLVCCFLKEFFRSLHEPLITYKLWWKFAEASKELDKKVEFDMDHICSLISELPRANRDTMAWILRHLLIVSQSPFCKMNSENLAVIFGPSLIGYSSTELNQSDIVNQTAMQYNIMKALLRIDSDHWQKILKPKKLLRTKKTPGLARRPSDVVNAHLSKLIKAKKLKNW